MSRRSSKRNTKIARAVKPAIERHMEGVHPPRNRAERRMQEAVQPRWHRINVSKIGRRGKVNDS